MFWIWPPSGRVRARRGRVRPRRPRALCFLSCRTVSASATLPGFWRWRTAIEIEATTAATHSSRTAVFGSSRADPAAAGTSRAAPTSAPPSVARQVLHRRLRLGIQSTRHANKSGQRHAQQPVPAQQRGHCEPHPVASEATFAPSTESRSKHLFYCEPLTSASGGAPRPATLALRRRLHAQGSREPSSARSRAPPALLRLQRSCG